MPSRQRNLGGAGHRAALFTWLVHQNQDESDMQAYETREECLDSLREQVVVDAALDHQREGGELVGPDVQYVVRMTLVAKMQVPRVEVAGKDLQVPDV
jgi:hypothetical protein